MTRMRRALLVDALVDRALVSALVGALIWGGVGCAAPSGSRSTTRTATPVTRSPRVSVSAGPTTSASTKPSESTEMTPAATVTTLRVHVVDGSRETVSHGRTVASTRTLDTEVLLPADRHGRPVGRALPWVVFLHGYGVDPDVYAPMLETWAREGFAVAAPTLPLTSAHAGAALDEADMVNEPADVSFLIDELLERSRASSGPLTGRLDPTRIAVAGHSDGANVAFSVGYSQTFEDPRIDAVIDLSGELPDGMGPFDGTGPPLLVMHSDQDALVAESSTVALYGALSVPRWWVELHGADHAGPFTGSAPWVSVVGRVTVDFLQAILDGSGAARTRIALDGTVHGVASLRAQPPDPQPSRSAGHS